MKIVFFLLSSLICLIACQSGNDALSDAGLDLTNLENTSNSIVGSWSWVRSDGGFAFHIHDTPESTGKTIQYNFLEGGMYDIIINGITTSNGTYRLSKRRCIHSGTDKVFIEFSSEKDIDLMIERINAEEIECSDEVEDGVGSLFRRVSVNNTSDNN